MRLENVNWKSADKAVITESRRRALKAAEAVKREVSRRCPVGTTSRPMYKTGKYAGQKWTKHDAGQLKRTVRVVIKKDSGIFDAGMSTFVAADLGYVRVYAGDYYAYYAAIVEYHTPFMRPAAEATRAEVARIMENG